MNAPKPWMSYDDRLDQLAEQGMLVTNRVSAIDCLERIGHYRLSGYWFAFRERSGQVCLLDERRQKPTKLRVERIVLDRFLPGATFKNALDLYIFDKRLRLLILDALERVEVALRVNVSHTLGKLDRFAYLKPELFHDEFSIKLDRETGLTRHHDWLSKHAQLITRSKEDCIRYNRAKYGLPLAIWVACEVWDFGALSTLFAGMRESEQDAISSRYGINNGRVLATWLRSLNYLRNVCAHHNRLWNRNIVDQPRLPSSAELPWVTLFENDAHARARCFLLLKIIRHLLSAVHPRSTWPERMRMHLLAFPNLSHLGLNLAGMGAPNDWEASW